jgi:hypothetical protein
MQRCRSGARRSTAQAFDETRRKNAAEKRRRSTAEKHGREAAVEKCSREAQQKIRGKKAR